MKRKLFFLIKSYLEFLAKLIERQRIPIDLMLGLALKILAMRSMVVDNALNVDSG